MSSVVQFDPSMLKPLRPSQERAMVNLRESIRAGHRHIVVQAPCSWGKCHGKGTEVIMYDGSTKKVEDVVDGDLLMGPDSLPRKVLSTSRGFGPLYRITPKKGTAWVCNEVHVLSLKRQRIWQKYGNRKGGKFNGGNVVNIPLDEYVKKSGTYKGQYRLWRVPVDFEEKELPFPPYMLGVFLGDGSIKGKIAVTTMDHEIVEELNSVASEYGVGVRKVPMGGNKASIYYVSNGHGKTNPITKIFQKIGIYGSSCGDKYIPLIYKTSSRQQRLELLAGLIDTDGSVVSGGKSIEYTSKSKHLIEDFEFICRSLGFGVSVAEKKIKGVSYYRAHIHGDYRCIPTRIERKRVTRKRIKNRDVLVSGFSVDPIGSGEYFGFCLDGDHLYLLKDFTVTHNTEYAINIAAGALGKGNNVLMTAPRVMLMNQHVKKFYTRGIYDIGVLQADNPMAREDAAVQIASMQTLIRRIVDVPEIIIVDECHLRWKKFEDMFKDELKNKLVIGLTATPWRKGMGLVWDDLIIASTIKEMIADGFLYPTEVYVPQTPELIGRAELKLGSDNDFTEASCDEWFHNGKRQIVGDLIEIYKQHGAPNFTVGYFKNRKMAAEGQDALNSAGYKFEYIDCNTPDDERERILKAYREEELNGICSVDTMNLGIDERVDLALDAQPTNSEIKHVQKCGRIGRHGNGTICDLAGNNLGPEWGGLGLYTEVFHDHLDTHKASDRSTAYEGEKRPAGPKRCAKCGAMMEAGKRFCTHCGATVAPQSSGIEYAKGELVLYGRKKRETAAPKPNMDTKREWYASLLAIEKSRNYKSGWAARNYREKYGVWPANTMENNTAPAAYPSLEVRNWVTRKNAEYAKKFKEKRMRPLTM